MLQRLFETSVQPNASIFFLGLLFRRICLLLSTCKILLVSVSLVTRVLQLQKTNFTYTYKQYGILFHKQTFKFCLTPCRPISSRAVLCSNWQTGGARFKPLSRLSTQTFGVFRAFLRNSSKYGLGSLRKTPHDGHSPCRLRSHKRTIGLYATTITTTSCHVVQQHLLLRVVAAPNINFEHFFFLSKFHHLFLPIQVISALYFILF